MLPATSARGELIDLGKITVLKIESVILQMHIQFPCMMLNAKLSVI
ncbi:hypothetical protein e1116g03.tmp0001 [Eimeria tenella]|uniref:Uncharacterized protein n=1 Tax=Eimeria tenella TaxID=5802 RepID=C8TE31_EIMTE|nr:hypothetical protein e1116g03.tmp0001 [Eimeria tenella]